MSNLAIGVEGGGTRTTVVIVDIEQSKTIYENVFEVPTNPYLQGLEKVISMLKDFINTAIKQAGCEHPKYLGITASGFNNHDSRLDEAFADYTNFKQCEDTFGPEWAYQAEFNAKPAIVIAGTGSAGLCDRNVGGLGHFMNEHGCGYSAVRSAIEVIVRLKDGFPDEAVDCGTVWEDFCSFYGFKNNSYEGEDFINLLYNKSKSDLARFNRKLCTYQNELAKKVYKSEFEYLAEMIAILRRTDEFDTVICVGSFWLSFKHQPEAKKAFLELISSDEKTKNLRFVYVKSDTAAVGVAMKSAGAEWAGKSLFADFWEQLDQIE